MNSDVTERAEKGKDVIPGIMRAAEQYGVRDQVLDIMTFDITKGPWRRGGWLDAIVTDPPCTPSARARWMDADST
jgi:tRNA (guanine10-N2)-methyltransferase